MILLEVVLSYSRRKPFDFYKHLLGKLLQFDNLNYTQIFPSSIRLLLQLSARDVMMEVNEYRSGPSRSGGSSSGPAAALLAFVPQRSNATREKRQAGQCAGSFASK
jgi:hypothetical protein